MKKIVILVGASGSGKSTWVSQQEKGKVVSADHFFMKNGLYDFNASLLPKAHEACQKAFREALEAQEPLIYVDNTSTRAWERKPYVDAAKAAGYEVWVKVFRIDPKLGAIRNLHGVPIEAIQKMDARIDIPEGYYQI